MDSLELYISPQAIADLTEIWLYIADDSPRRADVFIDRLYQQCHTLTRMPKIGRKREELLPGLRSFPVGRYIIFYRIREDQIEIVRVLSSYRDIESLFYEEE
jgi:addiction module RelE/StbE family toxin